jgi:putative flavoprotein involved in K+ transport
MTFADIDPDSFPGKERVAAYFEAYAKKIAAPIRCGVEVMQLERLTDSDGFHAETPTGAIEARNVVLATGPFQRPVIPALVPARAVTFQIHSNAYKNPAQLPAGAVLVVGSGSSGTQIADELRRSGRAVFLSVGPHAKPPRAYRGKDYCWWLGVLGVWDVERPHPGMEHVTIAVSGAYGGKTVDFRKLAADGITLLGRTERYAEGQLHIAPDLGQSIAGGDADYLSILDRADAYAAEHGLDLPLDPDARQRLPDPACVTNPILRLDVKAADITSIIWATGYRLDFGWVKMDIFDTTGRPYHTKGVCTVPGLYAVGLPWLSRRASSFIWGVWHDAKYIADHIKAHRT